MQEAILPANNDLRTMNGYDVVYQNREIKQSEVGVALRPGGRVKVVNVRAALNVKALDLTIANLGVAVFSVSVYVPQRRNASSTMGVLGLIQCEMNERSEGYWDFPEMPTVHKLFARMHLETPTWTTKRWQTTVEAERNEIREKDPENPMDQRMRMMKRIFDRSAEAMNECEEEKRESAPTCTGGVRARVQHSGARTPWHAVAKRFPRRHGRDTMRQRKRTSRTRLRRRRVRV